MSEATPAPDVSMDQAGHNAQTITPSCIVPPEEGHSLDITPPQEIRGAPADVSTHEASQNSNHAEMKIGSTQPPVSTRHYEPSLLNAGYPGGFEQERNSSRNKIPDSATHSQPSSTPGIELDQRRPNSSSEILGPSSRENTSDGFHDIFSELMTGTEHETAFLTRHFSEFLGPWYRYFPSNICTLLIIIGWTCPTLPNFLLYMPPSEQSTMTT